MWSIMDAFHIGLDSSRCRKVLTRIISHPCFLHLKGTSKLAIFCHHVKIRSSFKYLNLFFRVKIIISSLFKLFDKDI